LQKPAKKFISFQRGMKLRKTINFGGKLSFILSFLSPERLHCCYIYFSLLLTVQLLQLISSLVHWMLNFSISYWDFIEYEPFNGVSMAVPIYLFFLSLSSCSTNKIRIQIFCSAMSVKVWMQLLRNLESQSLSIDIFSLFQNRTKLY